MQNIKTKLIFVTGGVVSSLGKGIASASIGCILKSYGYKITIKKLDPYLNVDPGTMNPIQHGEVFVTNDGTETDLDLGHYERFIDENMSKNNNITSGKIYKELIDKERRGDYLGQTVQVIPHVTDLIKDFILKNANNFDFIITEIGGTVGDIEGKPFLEAIRQLSLDVGRENSMVVHLTYIPYLEKTNEIKTKPTQHSVRDLMYAGIDTNIILCRTRFPVPSSDKKKIALACSISENCVIEAPDVNNIYSLPYIYEQNGLGKAILNHFKLNPKFQNSLSKWNDYVQKASNLKYKKIIAIAGKYSNSNDCYKSLFEAINHAGIALDTEIEIKWIDTKSINDISEKIDAIIVPGGFGNSGTEGKLQIIQYAREKNIPFLGICFGMQLTVIEFAKNVLKISEANSTELNPNTSQKIVGLISEFQNQVGLTEKRNEKSAIGGTMRLGLYEAIIQKNTLAYKIYQQEIISERHRHRYEINHEYLQKFENSQAKFSAFSKDNPLLPEIFEISDHKFFISCQFHPEFLSRPFKPHPLFLELIKSTL